MAADTGLQESQRHEVGRRRLLAGAAAVAVVGFALGQLAAGPQVLDLVGQAHSAEGAVSIEADGWTYSVPLDVRWEDAQGSWHDGGRPACLPPTAGVIGPVRFRAVEVTVDGTTWRPVVFVSCRA